MTAPGYRRGRCSVTGKAQYTTRRVAKRVARGFNDNSRPYRCESCGHFHLGHLKQLTRAEHREYHGWGSIGGDLSASTPKVALLPTETIHGRPSTPTKS